MKKLEEGVVITADAIRSVRPGFGLAPKHFNEILGKKLAADVLPNSPVTWESIDMKS